MTHYRTALFDLDGTLTDPEVGILRSLAYALEEVGRPVDGDLQTLRHLIGPPLVDELITLMSTSLAPAVGV